MHRHRRRPDRRSFGEVLIHTFLGTVTGAVLGGLCFFGLAFVLGVGGGGGWHPLLGGYLVMIPFIWLIPGGALAGGLAINWWMARENRARRGG